MQNILSGDMEKSSASNLGILSSCLIPECGHKHLYTVIKKDIDGLHKDKLHRLTPASFTVSATKLGRPVETSSSPFVQISVLFDYVPTPPAAVPTQSINPPTDKSMPNVSVKVVDNPSTQETSLIVSPTEPSSNKDPSKSEEKTNSESRRTDRSTTSPRRAFALYENALSDWDSTDSESGPNEDPETCQTRC